MDPEEVKKLESKLREMLESGEKEESKPESQALGASRKFIIRRRKGEQDKWISLAS